MTKQDKIDKIYEVIADKTLSFWCRIIDKDSGFVDIITNNYWDIIWLTTKDVHPDDDFFKEDIMKIIWHPVMIGDVLDWAEKNKYRSYLSNNIIESENQYLNRMLWITNIWWEKRKPIEEQSDICIDIIYDLKNKLEWYKTLQS